MSWYTWPAAECHPRGTDLDELRRHTRLSERDAAALCGVTLRTWRRWCKAPAAPLAAWRLVALMTGWVPCPWVGWSFGQGCLWSPTDERFTPGDLAALGYLKAALAERNREALARPVALPSSAKVPRARPGCPCQKGRKCHPWHKVPVLPSRAR